MKAAELTARQAREKDYYDQYAETYDLGREIDFAPVDNPGARPWNSYWTVYAMAAELFRPGAQLLDFGSGPGENALKFARLGFAVEGFDISETNVRVAGELAQRHGFGGHCRFQVASAEALPYGESTFDLVVGVDILHHVDVRKAVAECHRVLKPGGVALFREPLVVPALDGLRNSALVRRVVPQGKSFELHVTEDERKLDAADLSAVERMFPDIEMRRYSLIARFDRFFRRGNEPHPSLLEQWDHDLMDRFPWFGRFGAAGVMKLRKSA